MQRELTMILKERINGVDLEIEIDKKTGDRPGEVRSLDFSIREDGQLQALHSIDPDDLPRYAAFFTRAAAEYEKIQEFFK